ncbi:hypothetical protein K443DRAFT_685361 [Laccaria amethystina LaAM-08-1]|uniref:Unplaced genomic scaffold K443scaffold_386, whole genome shotgun sequence n=1 Tax=Laccaria amethystina LaAM-08-1 TaxID=1095629 RepID=A0A0C9WI40_9AGAR|nr:hypothetical protein K443DRAFT_685361 [Laccaria amethystina LaAM-08-1]
MSEAIVLPSLSQWTKNHLTAIIQATSASALNASLDAFLFKDAVITVNGRTVTRAEFTTLLGGEKLAEAAASISFAGAVEVPTNPKSGELAGSVGVFFTAIIAQAIVIHDAPVEHQLTASINVVIEQDESLPPPPHNIRGYTDRRRVKVLNEVVLNGPLVPKSV